MVVVDEGAVVNGGCSQFFKAVQGQAVCLLQLYSRFMVRE